MLAALFILIITGAFAFSIVNALKQKHPFIDGSFLKKLFFYHAFLAVVYYLYALFNRSDSRNYYFKVIRGFRGQEWFDYYGTSTTFIEFLGFPFIKYLGFSYEAMMVLFAFLGYLGFIFMYIFFKENIKFVHRFLGVNLLTLFFLLPNLHFWSGSLGKGAVIFLGIGLFFYGITNVKNRWFAVLMGGLIIYHVRPHVMLVILVSSVIGFVFSTRGQSTAVRLLFLAGAALALFYIYSDVLTLIGIEDDESITEGLDLSHRVKELSKATSGIDISNYTLIEKLFAFLYRPLFFDAPGLLGFIVSFENIFYLLITLKILNLKGLRFILTGNFLVKTAFLSFITVSIALAQISGNLGLAIRQKSQVMMLFLFIILSFLDMKKLKALREYQYKKMKRNSRQAIVK